MSTFLKNLGKAVPTTSTVVKETLNPSKSLKSIQSDIRSLRAQFWMRKALNFGDTINAAKPEFKALVEKLKVPGEWTVRDLAVGGVWFIHLYGSFCIGEVIGRMHLIGYAPGFHFHG